MEFQGQETPVVDEARRPMPLFLQWAKAKDKQIADRALMGRVSSVNTQTANYILALTDAGKVVETNVGSANTLTVPANATVAFPVGTWIPVSQYGAGQTTLTPAVGVTIRARVGLKLAGQYAQGWLYKRGTNEWMAGGDLAA